MNQYYRPIPRTDLARPKGAFTLAGGWCWFDQVEILSREAAPEIIPAQDMPGPEREQLCAPRSPLFGKEWSSPWIMGILNATPDSFSDGGLFLGRKAGLSHGAQMRDDGADILDIGGESTRPGAAFIPVAEECARVLPVITGLVKAGVLPISVDTRKAAVAEAALEAGAGLINDVSGGLHDPDILRVAAHHGAPICLMHSQGDPKTMQLAPSYEHVLLDIYDDLAACVARAEAAGIPRSRILLDPGIGFGKTLEHNLALLRRLSLFHGLGCPLLLGLSRKSFIGVLAGVEGARQRMPGSLAAGLAAVAQGAQILRVHDVAATRQALSVMMPLTWQSGDIPS
ncbi:MAG: dihydropteroate synthase [Mangrovicoccus sp.]|nr:dihydropteroate synthase [Mangrovicoccus sp.]